METKMYWTFDGQSVSHISTPESLETDVRKMAKILRIPADTKYTIHNGNDQSTTTNATDSINDTACPTVEALSVDFKKGKTRKATVQLRDLSGDVDRDDDTLLGVLPASDHLADSSASDWFSNE